MTHKNYHLITIKILLIVKITQKNTEHLLFPYLIIHLINEIIIYSMDFLFDPRHNKQSQLRQGNRE